MRTKALALVALSMIIGGTVCLVIHFDGDWDRIGALVIIMGGQVAVSAYFAGKRGNLDDAFQAGFQAGFYKGERVRPKVVRLPTERHPKPALHR